MTEENNTIGSECSKARESKGITIDEVVEETKIRAVYVSAIEKDDFSSLPGGIYTKGYIKTYALFLDLDVDEILQKLDKSVLEKPAEEFIALEPYRDEFTPSPLVILISIILVAIAYFAWTYSNEKDVAMSSVHEQKVIKSFADVNPVVTLLAIGDVQISLVDSGGHILTKKAMKMGDTHFIDIDDINAGATLISEDMSMIEVYLSGEKVVSTDNLKKKNNGLLLDIDKLKANLVIE